MEKYNISMRVLHWLMAVVIITLLSVGFWMTDLPNDYPGKFDNIYPMHKSFGLMALMLIVIRIIDRLRSNIPQLPQQIIKRDRVISAITLSLLYFCMLAQPISGYMMSALGGREVFFFGVHIPSLFAENKELAKLAWTVHFVIAYALVVLIVLHLAGSTKHYIMDKVNLLSRMW